MNYRKFLADLVSGRCDVTQLVPNQQVTLVLLLTALYEVHQLLDGKEWDADMENDLAEALNKAGLPCRDPHDDSAMSREELQAHYEQQFESAKEAQHTRYGHKEWRQNVSISCTLLGYWDWVYEQVQAAWETEGRA